MQYSLISSEKLVFLLFFSSLTMAAQSLLADAFLETHKLTQWNWH